MSHVTVSKRSLEIHFYLCRCFDRRARRNGHFSVTLEICEKFNLPMHTRLSLLALHVLKALDLGRTSRLTGLEHLRLLAWQREYGHEISGQGVESSVG